MLFFVQAISSLKRRSEVLDHFWMMSNNDLLLVKSDIDIVKVGSRDSSLVIRANVG